MKKLQHKFVQFIPEVIQEEILYISMEYSTAIHKCVCGCGKEVVTPLSPTDWSLTYNGESISLNPSIGNWNFECKSHYWIWSSEIKHCRKWSKEEIISGQQKDKEKKKRFFASKKRKRDEGSLD